MYRGLVSPSLVSLLSTLHPPPRPILLPLPSLLTLHHHPLHAALCHRHSCSSNVPPRTLDDLLLPCESSCASAFVGFADGETDGRDAVVDLREWIEWKGLESLECTGKCEEKETRRGRVS